MQVAPLICDNQSNGGNSDVGSYLLYLGFYVLLLLLKSPLGMLHGEMSREICDAAGKYQ